MSIKTVKRTLICITDGSTREFLDDGSDVDGVTGKFKAHRGRRNQLVAALEVTIPKGTGAGTKVFWAEEKWAPLFEGDPLPSKVQVITPEVRKLMEQLVDERRKFLDQSKVQADNEAALALKKAKRANEAAAQS